jgi:hypothetical protein
MAEQSSSAAPVIRPRPSARKPRPSPCSRLRCALRTGPGGPRASVLMLPCSFPPRLPTLGFGEPLDAFAALSPGVPWVSSRDRVAPDVSCPPMRHLRQSGLPAPILGLLFGFALLGPELGHTLAHREHAPQATVYSLNEHAVAEPGHAHADIEVGDTHAPDAHAHFDLCSSPPSKPSLTFIAAVWTVVQLQLDLSGPPSFPPTSNVSILWDRYHGPPPPSRAPPLS